MIAAFALAWASWSDLLDQTLAPALRREPELHVLILGGGHQGSILVDDLQGSDVIVVDLG
jgi:hypothetical protein